MARIGFLTLSAAGHLNPTMALAKALQNRGHEIVFFNATDAAKAITGLGLDFVPYGLAEYPIGSLQQTLEKLGKLNGAEAFQFTLQLFVSHAQVAFRELPQLISERNVDALVIDETFPGAATVAQHLGLPYASLANALSFRKEAGVPPPFLNWDYEASEAAEARNLAGWQQMHVMFTPWRDFDNAQRIAWGLTPYTDLFQDSFSSLAEIANQPEAFDFPRKNLPASFYYAGPFLDGSARQPVEFPWERLDGRPLIYASMGTVQNGLNWIFRVILEACTGLDAQLVLSLGGGAITSSELHNPQHAIIVPYAPQPQLLERAALCITHAGLNTTLESLSLGVPMVAIPIANDQPAVAARIRYTQTGDVIPLEELTADRLHNVIKKVLGDSAYRDRSQTLQRAIAAERPLIRACEIIESKVLSKIPKP